MKWLKVWRYILILGVSILFICFLVHGIMGIFTGKAMHIICCDIIIAILCGCGLKYIANK